MRLFLVLIASLVIATLAEVIVFLLAPGLTALEWRSDQVHPVGNLSFALALALFIVGSRSTRPLSVSAMLAVSAFLILVAGIVYLAVTMGDPRSEWSALLMSPIGTIGSYPGGADMPFTGGITQWAATALVPIALGLLLGVGARRLRRA